MGTDRDADSNFVQPLHFHEVDCPEMKLWMNKKTNEYTSH